MVFARSILHKMLYITGKRGCTVNKSVFYAHSLPRRPESEWQPLEAHLKNVAGLAARFAAAFMSGECGRLVGLWHDLGKYRPEFQQRLHDNAIAADHKTAGALLAARWGSGLAKALAMVILGHHGGLPDAVAGEAGSPRSLEEQLRDSLLDVDRLLKVVPADIREACLPSPPAFLKPEPGTDPCVARCRSALWTRMLYSCLVDADWLDTEDFHVPGMRACETAGFASVGELRRRLDAAVDERAASVAPSAVNAARAEILAACRTAAERPPGIFSLTAPTGGGKTLAAMSFALRHAERHGLERVIAVAPFTSIIDQNAGVYRRALGAENVIEHHSNVDAEKESDRNRLASENWDAPVVVTTAVQFLESLFSNKPSRCRKLHNVARSVLLMDEAQTLPADLLVPVLMALKELVRHYGCTLVLSTATQPALGKRDALPDGFDEVHEMIQDAAGMAARLRRVAVAWPDVDGPGAQWPQLAAELVEQPHVLAIVHRRQDARELAGLLPPEGRFHLSALMCPKHRKGVLRLVRRALGRGTPCRLVATQLIEAGVDVDFPVVYRALGGLDSIAQAAGRCNREGRLLPTLGQVVVFRAPTDPPPGAPRKGLESTRSLLRQHGGDLDLTDPTLHEEYFRSLYHKIEKDARGIAAEESRFNFATVAARFRMIDDAWTRPVVVPYPGVARRLERLRKEGPNRLSLRGLQPFLVNVPLRDYENLESIRALEIVDESVAVLTEPFHHLYHREFGLVLEPGSLPLADPSRSVV